VIFGEELRHALIYTAVEFKLASYLCRFGFSFCSVTGELNKGPFMCEFTFEEGKLIQENKKG
jgi:hypothetical protein